MAIYKANITEVWSKASGVYQKEAKMWDKVVLWRHFSSSDPEYVVKIELQDGRCNTHRGSARYYTGSYVNSFLFSTPLPVFGLYLC